MLALSAVSGLLRAASPEGEIASHPLAPKSGPRGATLFADLPPEQTGIVTVNNYDDPKMWSELSREFELGSIGSGVTIGDFDNDGKPDVFIVSKTDSCRLFRNLGNWKFEDVTEKAGVADVGPAARIWKQGATFVDINNDGLLDIYICRFNAPNLLYINQGDGTFKEMAHAYGLDVKDASVMAAFCDYDRDGWLDVFIQTNLLDSSEHAAGQRNYLFHNNRDGTFTNVTKEAGISGEAQGHSATWWDFDNDGWPDLYVANDFYAPDKLYRNNRDGTFTDVINEVVPHTPYSSMGSDLGDLNNDGLIDLFVPDMAATSHEKDQRGMADSRSRTRENTKEPRIAPQYEHNVLYLNTGTGRCQEAAYLAGLDATDWTWSPRFEDLDNDGRLDLFVTNGMYREATNVDLLARQMSALNADAWHRIMKDSPILVESKMAFRNLGNLEFENVSAAWGLNQKSVGFGSAFGDLDGDGDLDIVYTNYQKGPTVLRNDSDTGHRLIIELRGRRSNRFGVGSKVTIETASGIQVRQLVLGRGVLSSSEPILHFGLGNDTLIRRMTIDWSCGQRQVIDNVGVDQRLTITEPLSGLAPADRENPPPVQPLFKEISSALGLDLPSAEEPVDETAQQRLLPFRLNRRGPYVALGDINGDGLDDLVIGGTTQTPASILLNSKSGRFTLLDTSALLPFATINDGPVLLFDATGRGRLDLLVTRGGNLLPPGSSEYQPRLLLNDGRGGFVPAAPDALPPITASTGAVVAADFDHDGLQDLFIGSRVQTGQYPLPPRSFLLINKGGHFEDLTDSLAPALREVGMVTAALWTDVDGDGWADLLLTLEWGNVRYFHNNQGKGLEDWTDKAGFSSAGTGWWTAIATADFNGDGRPDFVVGNVGLNTQYKATKEHPALLFYGDFKGGGEEPQIVEAYYEGDRLYPWRTRKDLGVSIPAILKRYPKNNAYAHATLEEILGPEKLAAAQRFEATELRSGVFLSQPDGRYRFEPLPRIVQIAPIEGIVAGDFDGDGKVDLFVVQNSYAPVPLIGRWDGGLGQLLKGDGHGGFVPIAPRESGLVVPGDAKAVVPLKLRQGTGFFVTRNNDRALAFGPNTKAGD